MFLEKYLIVIPVTSRFLGSVYDDIKMMTWASI